MSEDLAGQAWKTLKQRCRSDPANRCVLVSRADFDEAIAVTLARMAELQYALDHEQGKLPS